MKYIENYYKNYALKEEEAKTDEEVIYRRSERRAGSFQRRFQLPDTADVEKVEAANRNGVLEITIAKQEKAKPKRIEVAA